MKNKTLTISLISLGLIVIVFSAYAKFSNHQDQNNSYNLTLHNVPDTNIIINGNNLITKYYDEQESTEKELKIELKDGKIRSVYLNGDKLSRKEQNNYKKEIDHSLSTAKKAKEEIKLAKEELEQVNLDKIYEEIDQAQKEIDDIDLDQIHAEIEMALKEVEEINKEEIAQSLALAKSELEKINWDEINIELQNVQLELEETFRFLENEDIQRSIDISIDHLHQMIPDIEDLQDVEKVIIHDSSQDENNTLNEEKETELDAKLRSLEKK